MRVILKKLLELILKNNFKIEFILIIFLFILTSCTNKEEEEDKAKAQAIYDELLYSSHWTNPNSKGWSTSEKHDPFSGFSYYWLYSPIGESNDSHGKVRMVVGCSTEPDKKDWVYFLFENYLSLDLSKNEITVDNLSTTIFWYGDVLIKVFDVNKAEKMSYPISQPDDDVLHAVNDASVIGYAIELGNNETSMLLKVPLTTSFTYFILDFTDIDQHYTEFKNNCP